MAIRMDDFKDQFSGTGVETSEPVKPEDEFYHAIYIGHSARKNHIGVIEEPGKFHIRGVEYNLDEVYMIITLTKKVLAKTASENNKDVMKCFSFQDGPLPYKGVTGKICGLNSNERALDSFCSQCRAQIIVSGILCDSEGTPFKTDEGKPVFGFIRGKGMRYKGVSDHIVALTKLDLEPIVKPVTDESKDWEKKHINQSRVVTKITRDIATSQYNSSVNVFKFEVGPQLPVEAVEKILDITKKTVDKFKEKFDWSKSKAAQVMMAAKSYGGATEAQKFGNSPVTDVKPDQKKETKSEGITETKIEDTSPDDSKVKAVSSAESFGFDDLDF